MKLWAIVPLTLLLLVAQHPPSGSRVAIRGPNGSAILPGGRVIQPLGQQFPVGPGPCGLVSDSGGQLIVTVNAGLERPSVSVLEARKGAEWTLRNFFAPLPDSKPDNKEGVLTALSCAIALVDERTALVSEGSLGLVRLVDLNSGPKKKSLNLNDAGATGSYAGALAFDAIRSLVYVLDEGHPRLIVFELRGGERVATLPLDFTPRAISLSPDARRIWIAGTPLAPQAHSLCVVDVEHPEMPRVLQSQSIEAPSRVLAAAAAVYVSSAGNDRIDVLDPITSLVRVSIPLRIPGFEPLRGIVPLGMALDSAHQRLLVAEAGINAVGVVDIKENRLVAHLPAGWFPTAIAVRGETVLVANAEGRGTGPSSVFMAPDEFEFAGTFHRGSVSLFPWPTDEQLRKQTQLVFAANGLAPAPGVRPAVVPVKSVVWIVKEDRAFDEVFGDLKMTGAQVAGLPRLAHFGEDGYARGGKGSFSLQGVNVTPNEHALAHQFSVSDNFYADGESSGEGDRWLSGLVPEDWATRSGVHPQAGKDLWANLAEHHISFRNFGGPGPQEEATDYPDNETGTPDQLRAAHFIQNIESSFAKPGAELPQFVYISLPNDRTAKPRRHDGFPYSASYVTDNDVAVGKIIDYLSHSPWWPHLAIFVTESNAQGGRDHIDSHRTILLGVGPYFFRHYVSHTNANFPSLLKTTLALLHLPPMNLFEASACSLDDMLSAVADLTPYTVVPPDERIFDASLAKAAAR